MDISKAYQIIFEIACVTFSFRLLPFVFYKFLKNFKTLEFIQLYLPASIMLLLTIYTLKDVSIQSPGHGFIELISSLIVIAIHSKWRNALFSIASGTSFFVLCQHMIK